MKKLYKIGVALLATFLTTAVDAQIVSIVPASPTITGNCYPFGQSQGATEFAFVYKNIPAFTAQIGDTLAFDLGGLNDVDILRNIYMAPTDTNGSTFVTNWTQVVSVHQTPQSPKGNLIVGDYELKYVFEHNFSFSGGGMAIGFHPDSIVDNGCEQILVSATSLDTSNYFLCRTYSGNGSLLDSNNLIQTGTVNYQYLAGFVITEGVCKNTTFNLGLTKANLKLTCQEDSVSYQWLDCANNDSVLVGDTNKSITGIVGAEYKVVITNAEGCVDTSDCATIIKITAPSGINAAYADGINVTPNPTKGLTMITLPNSYTEYNLSVYDLVGKEVINKSNVIGENTDLNLNGLEKGVYFLKISDGNNYNRSLQIIKE